MIDEPSVEEFRLLLSQGEPVAPKAARLRPLLPRVVQRLEAGAPRKVIVEQLNRAGLDISLHDLAKQLQRFRKATRAGTAKVTTQTTPQLSRPVAETAVRGQPDRIENPADLRRIRNMEVDLDALRREGEAMRRHARNAKNAKSN